MKYYFYSILSFLLVILLESCGTEEYTAIAGNIEGTVIDEISKEAIESCEVISSQNGTTLTDSHGHYSFQDLTPGIIQLTYKRFGYETTTREYTVQAGKTTPANASLTPEKAECRLTPNKTILDFGNRDGVAELILKNTSTQSIAYTIKCDATEITFEPQKGIITGNNSSIIKVSVDRSELSEGHYDRVASIVTSDSSIDIQILFDKGSESRPKVNTLMLEQDYTTPTTIVANGAITAIGSSNIIQHGFCYSTQPEPSLTENEGMCKLGSLSSPANFSYYIKNLDFDKTYYVRAYATNKQGTSYGEVASIVLESKDNISVETLDATSITATSATLNIRIEGGTISDFSEIGFYYGITEKCEKKIVVDAKNYPSANQLCAIINELQSDTEYFFKGYGITSSGEKVGEIKSFKTSKSSSPNPTPTGTVTCFTNKASDVSPSSVVMNGYFSVTGTLKIKEWGFFYGTNSNPSIRSVCETNSTPVTISSKTISQKIEKLSEGATYFFQTYVIDELNNIIKGSVESFTTTRHPTIVIDYLNVSRTICLSGKATLYPEGNTVLEAGFLYRTDGYDVVLPSNNNSTTRKVPCEIIENTITINNESMGGYLHGGYVRAYMILLDGTVIYNGPKIFVALDLPYPSN